MFRRKEKGGSLLMESYNEYCDFNEIPIYFNYLGVEFPLTNNEGYPSNANVVYI